MDHQGPANSEPRLSQHPEINQGWQWLLRHGTYKTDAELDMLPRLVEQ